MRKTLIIACLPFLFSTCKKDLPPCKGQCADVVFAGVVYDKTSGDPLNSQEVTVNLFHNPGCLFCTSYKVTTGKTGGDGHFLLNTSFDTSLLSDYHLNISVPVPPNYLQYVQPVGPGIVADNKAYASLQFYYLDQDSLHHLSFGFYPKTLLHINLHRTTSIVAAYPTVSLEFQFDGKSSIWGIEQRSTNKDTTITVNTSANIFTKIIALKQTAETTVATSIDSVRCSLLGNNTIDITY